MTQPTTREELQAGLHRAQQILNDFASAQQQDAALKASIVREVPGAPVYPLKKEWRGAGKFLLCLVIGFFIILSVVVPPLTSSFSYWGANDAVRIAGGIVVTIVTLGGPFAIAFGVKKAMNSSIQKDNERIAAMNAANAADFEQRMEGATRHNQQVVQQLNDLAHHIEMLRLAWVDEIQPWYPPSYVSVDAVSFFATAVDNQRADTLKEVVNLYEEYLHRNTMAAEAAKQTQLAAQLERTMDARMAENNRLQALQVVTGFATAAASTVTAVNSGRVVNNTADIANGVGQVVKNTGDIADKVNPRRNSLF